MTETLTEVVADSIDALDSIIAYERELPSDWLDWFNSTCIVLTGVGKSFDVARLGASVLQSVGLPAQAIHATDLLHGGLGVLESYPTTTVLTLSHSGRTREVLDVINHLNSLPTIITTVAITCSARSLLAGAVQHTLNYRCVADGSRHGTIPTVSTTAQLAWVNIIACAYADTTSAAELALYHPAGTLAVVYERMPSE